MLQLSGAATNRPIMSLRTGGLVATATAPLINPNNLKIEGWYCQDRFSKDPLMLLGQDVRDVIKQGLVVNDHDVLTSPSELVRLQSIIELQFELLGKPVFTVNKKRLGKVADYAFELPTLYIQKLYLSQPLMKSFTGGGLSIDRSQIIEITQRKVVVANPLQPTKVRTTATAAAT